MSDKVLISISEKENGLEVKIGEEVYGNLAIVGLLEKIKINILEGLDEERQVLEVRKTSNKYDA